MKLFFTSLLMLSVALGASARNFTLSSVKGPVEDGATIVCGYTEDDGEYIWDPELILNTNSEGTYTITAAANIPGLVKFCAITGNCTTINGSESRSGKFSAGRNVPLQLDIDEYSLIPEPVILDVTVTDGSETIAFTVNFILSEAGGINAVKVPSGNLRFSGRNLSYALNATEAFTLYNISGRRVYSRMLTANGNINLGNIPAGVYVYRCGNQTGKVILK